MHAAIDDQMRGRDPFAVLKEVAQAVKLPVGVAGGVNSETVAQAVAVGASYVIVGGAITKAKDPEVTTRRSAGPWMKGWSTPTTLFKRAGEAEIRQVLEMVSAANLSDALHRGGVLEGRARLFPASAWWGGP